MSAVAITSPLGDDRLAAETLDLLATARLRQGQLAEAIAVSERALALARPLNDRFLIARILRTHGMGLFNSGEDARAVFDEAAMLFQKVGDRAEAANVLGTLGCAELAIGDAQAARPHLEEALAVARELRNARRAVVMSINLGLAAHLDGDDFAARRLLTEALAGAQSLGDPECELYALLDLALTRARAAASSTRPPRCMAPLTRGWRSSANSSTCWRPVCARRTTHD